MGVRCKDSRSSLHTAFYTLANQIKSIRLYSNAIHAIRQHYPDGDTNIVDVGCAGGLFLLAVQVAEDAFNLDKPSRFNAIGVAFDPKEKKDTEKYSGCQTFMLEDVEKNISNWADVVTMFNVLEHVDHTSHCLRMVRTILKDTGILVIDVPNNQVMKWRVNLLRKWPSLDLGEHINHFTPKTIDLLMELNGFERLGRLPGLIQGASGLGIKPTSKQLIRWIVSNIVFYITMHRVQIFPHMTIIYSKKKRGSE